LRYFLNRLSEFLFNFEDEVDKQDAELDRMVEENFGRRYARCRNGGAVKKDGEKYRTKRPNLGTSRQSFVRL
jgi:hypothetical protein